MNRKGKYIQNLHSLLSSKWLITDAFANGLFPDLARLLQGSDPLEVKVQLPYYYSTINESFYYYNDEEDSYYDDDRQEVDTLSQSIAILPIKGPILKYSQFCGPVGTKEMSSYLDMWEKRDDIDGVLLDIDSGGGQASGTPEFAARIKSFSKPIVVYSDGMICSAAYWIAAASDYIIANEFCDDIGSIGTMVKGIVVDGIIEKAGGVIVEEYATKSIKKNYTWRELRKGNSRPYIEFDLDPINDRFHDMMRQYRPNLNESVFSGISFLMASDALENNLIDEIGTKERAISKLRELINKSNTNSNKVNIMSNNLELKALASVLGVEAITTKKGLFDKEAKANFSLTEEQLIDLENALNRPEVEALENQITSLNKTIENLGNEVKKNEEYNKVLSDRIAKAMQANHLEDKGSTIANLEELASKTEEYGKRSDTKPTNIYSSTETVVDGEEVIYESFEKLNVNDI